MTNELQQIYKYTRIATDDKRIATNNSLPFVLRFVAIRVNNILYSSPFVSKFVAISVFAFLPIFTILAADLYILPSSKDLNVGDNLNIAVYVDSIDQEMNAVSFKISYPEDLLRFVSLSKTGTIISLWVQEPRGGNGEVLAEGIVLNPGFTGSRGKILNITFKALSPGKADLSFVSGAVLANDGLGTNILKDMKGATYVIKSKVIKKEIVEQLTLSYLPTPKITSPTHPDQEKWYNNNNPVFEWKVPEGVVEVRVLYGKNPDAVPLEGYSPPISRKSLKGLSDGTYWFNVKFIGESTESNVGRFKFNIDTQPPTLEEFSLGLVDVNSIKLKIKAKDELAGINKIEVYLDNNLFRSFTSDSFEEILTNLKVGTHLIKIKALDKAGNFMEKSEIANISKEPEVFIERDYTLYFLILFILILLLIIILFFYLLNHKVEIIHKEIKKEKLDQIQISLRQHIKEILIDLKRNISLVDEDPKLSQKEKEVYKEVRNILEEAEKKIDEKLKELE